MDSGWTFFASGCCFLGVFCAAGFFCGRATAFFCLARTTSSSLSSSDESESGRSDCSDARAVGAGRAPGPSALGRAAGREGRLAMGMEDADGLRCGGGTGAE